MRSHDTERLERIRFNPRVTKATLWPASEPEEIARFEKKSVVCTVQIAESQSFGFRQQTGVAGEEHRAGRRLIREERFDAKPIPLEAERGREDARRRIADHDGQVRPR